MPQPTMIGTPPWTDDQMRGALEEFAELYERRPIRENAGGMRAPHAFLAWFVMRALQPKVIIESGVFLGQGTWLFDQACPNARIYCLDPRIARIEYKSKNASYHSQDFSRMDWTSLPHDDTVLFFDDHQDYYDRAVLSHWFGFTHLIFEDNYPAGRGNCYSPKAAFAHAGYLRSPKERRREWMKGVLGRVQQPAERQPNETDAKYLVRNFDCYVELPPVFKLERTRWGDPWSDERYPTPAPLLSAVTEPYQQVYLDEAGHYTWMAYARLKRR